MLTETSGVLLFPMIGFSLIIAPLMVGVYLSSPKFPRSWLSVVSCVCLTCALVVIQFEHLMYVLGAGDPFEAVQYSIALFTAPTLFFVFGRSVVLPDGPFSFWLLAACFPCILPLVLPFEVAVPMLLFVGAGYASWLGLFAYRARANRPQHRFEFLFSTMIFGSAAVVLVVGAFLPWLDPFWFFLVYSQSIGIAYLFVVFALSAIPAFVDDLFDEGRTRYATTTLGAVDIDATISRLNQLMAEEALYKDDALTLSSLAGEVNLTTHQLSELFNRHLGGGQHTFLVKTTRSVATSNNLLHDAVICCCTCADNWTRRQRQLRGVWNIPQVFDSGISEDSSSDLAIEHFGLEFPFSPLPCMIRG
ncbi:MAG: hypothetical protein AAF525_05560 [Pseudomonadota bacterium]